MLFRNLEAERVKAGMTKSEFCEKVGIPYNTLSRKLHGKSEFTLSECVRIKKKLGVDMPLDTLFEIFL